MEWECITAIATGVLALLMLGAFLVAWRQLRAMAKDSRGQFLMSLGNLYTSDAYDKSKAAIASITSKAKVKSLTRQIICARS